MGVAERGLEITVGDVPVSRPPVQLPHELRLGRRQLLDERQSEQPVVPIPHALPVEWYEEEARPLDHLELSSRALASEEGVAETPAHLLHDGGRPQELPRLGPEAREVLRVQVSAHVSADVFIRRLDIVIANPLR